MAGFYIEPALRPCYVMIYERDPKRRGMLIRDREEKALFHCWEQTSDVIEPSPMVGGHSGGVIAGMAAIVEREDGRVGRVRPEDIRFCDNKFKEYTFEDRCGGANDDEQT